MVRRLILTLFAAIKVRKRLICLFLIILICGYFVNWRKLECLWRYGNFEPHQWSETVPQVRTRIDTDEKILALTMDACGSKTDSLDEDLIEFLIQNEIPATMFITGRWMDKYPEKFARLAANPLFEIENHGIAHRPASLTGQSIYGIAGTKNAGELYDEVALNADKMEKATGRRPVFYRSGTAYYDEGAAQMIEDMGFQTIGFAVLGDKGATYSADEVEAAFLTAKPGDIIICHMNHPEKETGRGLMRVLPKLKARGFRFVLLKDYADKLK